MRNHTARLPRCRFRGKEFAICRAVRACCCLRRARWNPLCIARRDLCNVRLLGVNWPNTSRIRANVRRKRTMHTRNRQVQTPPREMHKFFRENDKSIRPAHTAKQAAHSAKRGMEAAGRDGNSGSHSRKWWVGFGLGALARGPTAKNKDLRPNSAPSFPPTMSTWRPAGPTA